MKVDDLMQYAPWLLKAAIAKTRNEDEAQDLVQETYLCALAAIAKGARIENPKAYLTSILNNRFFMSLRKKYGISTVSYDEMPAEVGCGDDGFESIEATEEAKTVRRELAFLARIYREVMVRYYMHGQSVEQIAEELNIPRGTVLSRLDAGRRKVKEGVVKMEAYAKNSYQPEKLGIGISGRWGMKEEPFSCVKNLIDQNILILAYEKPVTVQEISDALGVPMAFVEESVNKLVESELMRRSGTKVYTDFVITSLEDSVKAAEVSKDFAKDTFGTANPVLLNMVKKYREMDGFSVYSDTHLYIMAALSANHGFITAISGAIAGKNREFEDYPDRPNYGKWIAMGTRYPVSYKADDETERLGVSGRLSVSPVNENICSFFEWDTFLGRTHHANFKYSISEKERAMAIDAVRTNTVGGFQAELIPDLEKYGFIKSEKGAKVPAVPFITKAEEKRFYEIENEAVEEYCSLLLDKAVQTARENAVKYPGHISDVPDIIFSKPLSFLPMAYVYEARDRGVIAIEEGRNYPIMVMVCN